jgi:hypothetical protein
MMHDWIDVHTAHSALLACTSSPGGHVVASQPATHGLSRVHVPRTTCNNGEMDELLTSILSVLRPLAPSLLVS